MTRNQASKIGAGILTGLVISIAATMPTSAIAAESQAQEEVVQDLLAVADSGLLAELDLSAQGGLTATRSTVGIDVVPLGERSTSIPSLDGSFDALVTSISDSTATHEGSYEFRNQDGASVAVTEDGALASVVSDDGATIGRTVALWAKDADGREVPTHFELSEGTLTQVVDTEAMDDIAYPVVVVAAASRDWYSSAWVTSQGSDYVVHAVPTAAGKIANGIALLSTHTLVLKEMLGSNASKVTGTIENQFHCHVVFWPGMSSGNTAYDMESWRPNVSYLVAWASGCNP